MTLTCREFFEIQEAYNRIVATKGFKESIYMLLKKKYTAAQLRKAGIRNDTIMDKRNYKTVTYNKYNVDLGKIYALKRAGWNDEKIINEFGSRPSRKILMAAIKYVQNPGYRPPYMLEGEEPEEEPEEPDEMEDDDWEDYED